MLIALQTQSPALPWYPASALPPSLYWNGVFIIESIADISGKANKIIRLK
jgi:hypothetical protein